MFWTKFTKKINDRIKTANDFDKLLVSDIDATIAKSNYDTYQNDLRQRQQDIINKLNKKIAYDSSNGAKFLMTNQFVTDDDKDKILFMFDDGGNTEYLPSDATLGEFQRYYESKGFKVVKVEFPTNNICALKIIWVHESN